MFGIVANVVSDRAFRTGAKVRFIASGSNVGSVEVRGLSKNGRRITKFILMKRLRNFRAGFIPECLRNDVSLFWLTKAEATDAANRLTVLWKDVRFFYRDGKRLMKDGITEGQALEHFKEDANYRWRRIAPLSFMENKNGFRGGGWL